MKNAACSTLEWRGLRLIYISATARIQAASCVKPACLF